MTGNAYNSMSEAFANDVVSQVVAAGGNIEAAMGSDVAATFNLGSGLSKWVSQLNGGQRNHIVVIGDSNVQSVPAETFRWPVQLKTDLIAFTGIADGGPGFRHLGLPEWTIPAAGPTSTTGWITTGKTPDFFPLESGFTGTVSDMAPNGYGFVQGGQANLGTWTLASAPASFTHDRFVLYGQDDDFLVQQGEYSANGGAFTATAYNYGPATGNRLVTQEIATQITTTLRLRGSATGFPVYWNGVAFYQGTSGLIVHNLAVGGNSVNEIVGRNSANRLSIIDNLTPKLTIVWTGTNEFHHAPPGIQQVSLDTWYQKYLAIVQRARLYGDVLIVYPQATNVPNTFSQVPWPREQKDFERVARKIAYDTDSGFISMHQLWGTWSRHNARGYASDNHHINQAGHNAVSKVLTRAIRRVS